MKNDRLYTRKIKSERTRNGQKLLCINQNPGFNISQLNGNSTQPGEIISLKRKFEKS